MGVGDVETLVASVKDGLQQLQLLPEERPSPSFCVLFHLLRGWQVRQIWLLSIFPDSPLYLKMTHVVQSIRPNLTDTLLQEAEEVLYSEGSRFIQDEITSCDLGQDS